MSMIFISFCLQRIELFFFKLKSSCVQWLVRPVFPNRRESTCVLQCLVHVSARFPINPFPLVTGSIQREFYNCGKLQNGARIGQATSSVNKNLIAHISNEITTLQCLLYQGCMAGNGGMKFRQKAGWSLSGSVSGGVV